MENPTPSKFTRTLLQWFEQNHRPMPWKGIKDPYLIWISEVILQQTRVGQGWDYYLRFTERFPDILTLSQAGLDEVLKYWEGLGYYTRARNLHASAKMIMEKHQGIFPDRYEDIFGLKGIGKYTAAAISSFAFSQPYAVVDGNVYRALSRIFNISTPIDSKEGGQQFSDLANECIQHSDDPGIFNQSIMDFGATVCKPVNPDCPSCPFVFCCLAYKNNTIELLPVKAKKLIRRTRFFHYYIIQQNEHIYLEQRTQKDIWNMLFQFPLIESTSEHEPDKTVIFKDLKSISHFESIDKVFV